MEDENENNEIANPEEPETEEEEGSSTPNELGSTKLSEKIEELKKENDRMEKNIAKLEELRAFEILGGKSEGAPQEAQKKEETPQEYADRVMRGEI